MEKQKTMNKITKYKNYLIVNGYAKKSIATYQDHLEKFFEYSNKEISQERINNYILKRSEEVSNRTINGILRALELYIEMENLDIKLPKRRKEKDKLPEAITLEYFEENIINMIDFEWENNQIKIAKVKALLYFLFFTGLRPRTDALQIQRKNINFDKCKVKIYLPKQKKEMIKFFPRKVVPYLQYYFALEPEENNAFNIHKTSIENICRALDKWVDINFYPYVLRHSCFTYLQYKGMSLKTLQEFAGHEDISTTARYIKITQKDVEKAYREAVKGD